VAAPKQGLLEKSPGQFRDGIRQQGSQESDCRRFSIRDDRKRVQ
jgi:hypothetical protein